MRAGQCQSVTRVTVNKAMGLSRQERRKLRAALHRQKTTPADPATAAGERLRLMGKLAYLAMLNKTQAAALGWRKSAGQAPVQ